MPLPGRSSAPPPTELTPSQVAILERVVARGFIPVVFPLYASAVGIRRGAFAALLVPNDKGGLRTLGEVCYLIDGNLSVRVQRKSGPCFVWKSREVEATPELLAESERFSAELAELLLPAI